MGRHHLPMASVTRDLRVRVLRVEKGRKTVAQANSLRVANRAIVLLHLRVDLVMAKVVAARARRRVVRLRALFRRVDRHGSMVRRDLMAMKTVLQKIGQMVRQEGLHAMDVARRGAAVTTPARQEKMAPIKPVRHRAAQVKMDRHQAAQDQMGQDRMDLDSVVQAEADHLRSVLRRECDRRKVENAPMVRRPRMGRLQVRVNKGSAQVHRDNDDLLATGRFMFEPAPLHRPAEGLDP
jgi:hypothetical protein